MSFLDAQNVEKPISTKVEFDIIYDDDLICKYNVMEDHEVNEGDRIAVFKLGWLFFKDYVLFEWVTKKCGTVIFKDEDFPKDENEIYQLCYITGNNTVIGVSKPVQLCKKMYSMSHSTTTYRDSIWSSELGTSNIDNNKQEQHDDLVKKLREENDLLRNIVKMMVTSNNGKRDIEKELKELKVIVKHLKVTVVKQQTEIENLRKEFTNHTNICDKPEMEVKKFNFADLGELQSIPPIPILK